MKKITSFLLALLMIMSASVCVFAEEEKTIFSDVEASDYYAEAAAALKELNILSGYPDGTFGAEKPITRAEMAAIVCRMIEKEADAEKAKGETAFEDIAADHWASGYINVASAEKIINGDGNGKFRPADNVKHEEAIKMIVCALGYGEDVEIDANDWSKGYLEVADEKGISEGLKGEKGKASTRGDVAVLTHNGISAKAVEEAPEIPAAPVASKQAGTYTGTQKIALTTETEDAEIYYTLDGTEPTAESTKYTKEISVSKTTTIKAVAIKNGVASEGFFSGEYTIKSSSSGGGVSISGSTKKYAVTFDLNYDDAPEAPAAQNIKKGKKAVQPDAPTRDGYVFLGWSATNDVEEIFDFNSKINKKTTLYAIWGLDITAAEFQVNGASVDQVKAGDVVSFVTTPAEATGTIKWTVGEKALELTETTYTVSAFDMGKTIAVEFAGNGLYIGTVTAECTVENSTDVNAGDIMSSEADADSNPVVLPEPETTTFVDGEGNPVEVTSESTLTLTIENPEASDEEIEDAQTLVIESIINNAQGDLSEDELEDVEVVAVDVNLKVDETEVHPIGKVIVTLTAAQLGLEPDTDLTNYTFTANHTNKNNESENVEGTLVTIDGVQYIRFELNGLSTIWIGNVPPRTVNFYITEDDADNKVNSIGSVIVKFGDFTPTNQIPAATREGYLFCGWNFDMTRTPILYNLEVHALWTEGEKMPASNISAAFSEATDTVAYEISEGMVSIDSENKGVIPSGLSVTVEVEAPQDAVKYYVGTDAAVVAAFTNADEFEAVDDSDITIEVGITDNSGVLLPSSNTYYYKWLDENGAVISLQEITVKIANGTDGATSMKYTANVNRGIGKFEAYVIDSQDVAEDFVAYINNHLSGNAVGGYTLNNNVSFDGYMVDYDFSAYDTLKFVFTPFDGEEYDSNDEISVTGEYYDGSAWDREWEGDYEIKDGKLVVTYPFDVEDMKNDWAYATISLNGNEQEIDVNWDHGRNIDESEDIQCETWAEVVEAIEDASANKMYYIYCQDDSAITLTKSLKIPATIDVYLRNAASFTVANGATLTLEDDVTNECASAFGIRGDFIVADGGRVKATYASRDSGNRWYPSLYAANITFKSGSELILPEDTLLSIDAYNSSDEEKAALTFEAGSMVDNNGQINSWGFDTVNLNGEFNSAYYTYFHVDETNINGEVNHSPKGWGYFEVYGTINIGENGSVVVNNTSTGNSTYTNLEFYGPLTNKGSIEIKGNKARAVIMNNGFVNYNEGTISVASGCKISTTGTKFVNTGKISGEGILNAFLGDDYTNYDDGTEYVEFEDDGYWDSELDKWVYKLSEYSRYKFTHDPAETVEVTLYLSEVVNMGEGECTLETEVDEFPGQ